ncbi:MAG: hypothetical protein L6Q60_00270 [Rhodocyclaceae bacterium]|nr:hypothetical protein [Rhodocyclaceae bacterium]
MTISIRPPRWLTPITATLAGSLALSLIARLGSEVNRDGMLYVTTAQAFLDGGYAAAKASFGWPFLSIAIAVVAKLTGLGLENAAYLLNALFMAGACALIVASVGRRAPELAWITALTVLALPGFNEYRNELLREFGCWFFIALAWWLALRWDERPRWTGALAIQTALAGAALFRPEALALFPALLGWQIFAAPGQERWQRLAMIGLLPLVGGITLLVAYFGGHLEGRLSADLGRFGLRRFDDKANALAAALIDYARGQARTILLFGSLALVPIKLLQKFSLLLIPLAFFFASAGARTFIHRHALFAWGIGAHLLVVSVFVLDLQFLAGRYVGLILLLATPFIAAGLHLLIRRFPRWRHLIIASALLLAAGNVVSTGPGKGHFVEAGKWLAANVSSPERVYIDSGRTAYHAGWHTPQVAERNRRENILRAAANGPYDLFVLEVSRKDPPWDPPLERSGLQVVQRFELRNGDAVVIARPANGAAR